MTNSEIKKLLEEAWSQRRVGNYSESRILLEKAQNISGSDDYSALGRIFHIYAQFESDHDNPAKALEYYEMSLANYTREGNLDKIAHSTRHIADTLRSLRNYPESEARYREALAIYRDNTGTAIGNLANALIGFAETLEQRNKFAEAIAAWKEARVLYQECGIEEGVEMAKQKLISLGDETPLI